MPTWSQGQKQFFTANNGKPLVGGKLYTYAAGTTTPKAVFKDALFTIPHTNPVVLDSRGEELIYWQGLYKVVLKYPSGKGIWTVDSVNGDGLVLTTPDTVELPPIANFTFAPASPTAPALLVCTNTSTRLTGSDSFTWRLNGVAQSTSQNASISIAAAGTHEVSLTVENAYGDDTKTRSIVVSVPPSPSPSPSFTASPASGPSPLVVTFDNTSTFIPGDTFAWVLNGTTVISTNEELGVYTFSGSPGVSTIGLTITRGGTTYGPFTQSFTVTEGGTTNRLINHLGDRMVDHLGNFIAWS